MVYAKKIDANQKQIVMVARRLGASVAITSNVGSGFPDLVIGFRGLNMLWECKDGEKSPSRQKLTACQEDFHANWRGRIDIVRSMDDAVRILNSIK